MLWRQCHQCIDARSSIHLHLVLMPWRLLLFQLDRVILWRQVGPSVHRQACKQILLQRQSPRSRMHMVVSLAELCLGCKHLFQNRSHLGSIALDRATVDDVVALTASEVGSTANELEGVCREQEIWCSICSHANHNAKTATLEECRLYIRASLMISTKTKFSSTNLSTEGYCAIAKAASLKYLDSREFVASTNRRFSFPSNWERYR